MHLTFLGIKSFTKLMLLSLDQDKLAGIAAVVGSWDCRRSATKRELQSLIGHLSHVVTVVQPGRTFLRRMINLMILGMGMDGRGGGCVKGNKDGNIPNPTHRLLRGP